VTGIAGSDRDWPGQTVSNAPCVRPLRVGPGPGQPVFPAQIGLGGAAGGQAWAGARSQWVELQVEAGGPGHPIIRVKVGPGDDENEIRRAHCQPAGGARA
jgi:hypothetical protein